MNNNDVTKDMIAKLMDNQLGDDHLQDLQRMRRKDTDRFQKYIELIQERWLSPNKWCKSSWASTFSAPISSS